MEILRAIRKWLFPESETPQRFTPPAPARRSKTPPPSKYVKGETVSFAGSPKTIAQTHFDPTTLVWWYLVGGVWHDGGGATRTDIFAPNDGVLPSHNSVSSTDNLLTNEHDLNTPNSRRPRGDGGGHIDGAPSDHGSHVSFHDDCGHGFDGGSGGDSGSDGGGGDGGGGD